MTRHPRLPSSIRELEAALLRASSPQEAEAIRGRIDRRRAHNRYRRDRSRQGGPRPAPAEDA
jgi:hypothetical protein